MFTDEQEIISEINSDMEYTLDQLGYDEYPDFRLVTAVRYEMKEGKRLDRAVLLQRSTGKLFELRPIEINYYDLSEEEKERAEESVENWNTSDALPKITIRTKW